ncbi:MAG: 4-hydroxythreonine-4-phosphate dehydrogenase PdxA [bacterium]
MKPPIAITIGDFNGIGPEIILKSLQSPAIKKICAPVLVGPLGVFEHVSSSLKIPVKLEKAIFPWNKESSIPVVDIGDGLRSDVIFGSVTKAAGRNAGKAIEKAVELCVNKRVAAMVTAPISKEALNLAGYNFPGQTEMVTLFSRSQRVAMLFIAGKLKVGLVTIHSSLSEVVASITKEKVIEKSTIIYESLQSLFGIEEPTIAILGLNPHAGERGLMGMEEIETITPAIDELKSKGMNISGPYPADAFFGTGSHKKFDAIVALYHDQGLIPFKMLAFERGVNFSAGLPIIRTSPDHGTAYDIAGKGSASPESMIEAIKLAVQFSTKKL